MSIAFPSRKTAIAATTLVLTLLILMWAGMAGAEVRAWFDRSTVQMGETLTLNVESDSNTEPDFSVLEKDFTIAGRSTSSQMHILNGAMARTNLWAVALKPLREGEIALSGIPVGKDRTNPLTVSVRPMAKGSAAAGDQVFLEVEVDNDHPYVREQVGFTVRLFYAVQLMGGDLQEPSGDGLQIRRIGKDTDYSREMNGRRYNVIERRYSLIPERSGRVTIPGVAFQGRMVSREQFNSFFSQGTPVSTASEELVLDVRPAPDGAPEPWLPAQSLSLKDDAAYLTEDVHVGDALELTLTMQAHGVSAELLPQLTLPSIAGAEIYPDKEIRETSEIDGQIVGTQTRKFAIVPLREGTLELPERSVSWWNLQTDAAERSILPGRRLNVRPAMGGGRVDDGPDVDAGAIGGHSLVGEHTVSANASIWKLLALLLACGWLLTLLVWRWQVLRARRQPLVERAAASPRNAPALWQPALAQALKEHDLAAAGRALIRMRPETGGLAALADQLQDKEQHDAVMALERSLYRGDPDDGVSERLQRAFSRSPVFASEPVQPQAGMPQLPPLYPDSTGHP